MSRAYIGLGGNLGDVFSTMSSAVQALKQYSDINSVRLSSFYQSDPLGNADQPKYINAVAQLETTLTADQLLTVLQEIELRFGRVRTAEQWSSRTLDLDIILFDDLQLSSECLTIPHAGMLVRDFVLVPLFELAPELVIAGYGPLSQALQVCENRGLKKLNMEIN